MSEDCQKCGTAMYDLDEERLCPGCSNHETENKAITTNQTIDGVPRDLLASFAAYVADSPNAVMRSRAAELRALLDAPAVLGEIDLTPKRLAHAESVIEQQNSLITSLRAELVESYRIAALPQAEPAQEDRENLIGYGRSLGLDEASTLCTRLAYAAYYPPGTRFKAFTPKAQKALGDLLIKAANEIASLPGGPYERFKARQAKKAGSTKSR